LGLTIFKLADRVICLTLNDAKEIIKLGCPPNKVRLIPNAVDTELFKPGGKREDDLVVWVGRFVPEKGLDYLIKAIKIIISDFKFTDIRLLLVGYGPWKRRIMRLAYECGLTEKFVGFTKRALSRAEVARVLSKAAIFVLPSLREGLPLSLLEAMACELPVIGSDAPGINDVIINGENGLLVPAKDPEALAKAILTLLTDTNLRRKLGQEARKLAIEKYCWNSVINKIEGVYHEAMEEVKG
jgi:glycosyltransferase involved in cell wall biosynthesis